MEMSSLSASDEALLNNKGGDWGGNSFMWIFALLILAGGGFGGLGFGGQNAQTEVVESYMQRGFDNQSVMNKLADIGNGICDSAYALNNSILTEGRALQTQVANCCCETNRNIDQTRYEVVTTSQANTQKILDAISGNRMADMQNQINQLQLQAALCGVPKVNPYGYGICPQFCGCPTV